jgi:hypothetical protein
MTDARFSKQAASFPKTCDLVDGNEPAEMANATALFVAERCRVEPLWFVIRGPQRRDDGIESVGQRGRPWLENQRRLDLDNAIVAHSRNVAPARPLPDFVGYDFLAAP